MIVLDIVSMSDNHSEEQRYRIDSEELAGVKKICVIFWGLIGDVLLRVPVLEALKARFPLSEITVVIDPPAKDAIKNHPACSEVALFSRNKKPLFRYIYTFGKNVLYLRKQNFDLCANLYSGGSSPLITRLINARIRLGFDHTKALRKANNLLVKTPSFCGSWTKAIGVTLEPLGVSIDAIRRGSAFYTSIEAQQFASGFLGQKKKCYFAVNLGARVPEKRWPVERYAELASKIADQYAIQPLVFTNPGMEELSDKFILNYASDRKYIRIPLLSLDKVAALLEKVGFLVTGDTALMHLAFGVKCPTLVLFTHTRPELVEPDDCQHVPCFVEDRSSLDECGLPYGMADIPIEYALRRFEMLYAQLD